MWPLIGFGLLALALAVSSATAANALKALHRLRETNGSPETPEERARVERLLENPEPLRLTALVFKVVGVAAFLLAATGWAYGRGVGELSEDVPEPARIILCALFCLLSLVLLVEVFPAYLSRKSKRRTLVAILTTLDLLRRVLYPLVWLLGVCKGLMLRIANISEVSSRSREIAEEIIEVVSDTERQENLAPAEKDMIEGVVELRDTEVSEIMTPRTDTVGLSVEANLADVVGFVKDHGHSRIPVYRKSLDQIIGVFYVKDMVAHLSDTGTDLSASPVDSNLRKPYFIPETKKVSALLEEFRRDKLHMAIVLDEYGGTAGVITIEDILEEIVGEIVDEYDEHEEIQKVDIQSDGTAEVDAKVSVEEINEKLGLHLPEGEDFDTIGGFAFSSLGKVPEPGDRFRHEEVEFEILAADDRRIHKLRIHHGEATAGS